MSHWSFFGAGRELNSGAPWQWPSSLYLGRKIIGNRQKADETTTLGVKADRPPNTHESRPAGRYWTSYGRQSTDHARIIAGETTRKEERRATDCRPRSNHGRRHHDNTGLWQANQRNYDMADKLPNTYLRKQASSVSVHSPKCETIGASALNRKK